MILHYFSALWAAVAPALADHLWQSTLFALAAGLLTLVLRRNSARLRYVIWLAASLKFLVPFSVLTVIGSYLSWRHSATPATTGIYLVEEISQPFTQPSLTSAPVLSSPTAGTLLHLVPLLLGIWLCGFLVVLFIWTARWWRVSAAVRQAAPLQEGREVTALRRLERLAGMRKAMNVLQSRASLEPGVFGILRPALLWPDSISEHLDDSHLEAVLAHELCHVRRRDNLAAAVHMLVEAIFWFHPLVWWLGSLLIAERERACDEAVLELGSQRHIYAESILKVCEFCLSSPLTCVSGVTGADLKKRMVQIMTDRVVRKLNPARKLLLWTAACLAIALPIAFGLLTATPSHAQAQAGATPKFSTVSIKPHPPEGKGLIMTRTVMSLDSGFTATNISPHTLLQLAYHIQDTQLAGAPEWINSEKYDIQASVDKSLADEAHKLNEDQRNMIGQHLLQELLADYFKLTVHQESRDLPVYELLIADNGSKMQKTNTFGMMHLDIGELKSEGTPLALLTSRLSQSLGRTVVDKTGLEGNYIFALRWTPDAEEQARMAALSGPHRKPEPQSGVTSSQDPAPPLITAVQEQLGLKLEPKTERVQMLVIDHAEQPAAN